MENNKKVLVSDYDWTYNIGNLLTYYNNNKIKEFIGSGNIFAFSTLRNFKSMLFEIKKYKLVYNYLSLCNGSVLFDKNLSLLFKVCINQDVMEQILDAIKDYKKNIEIVLFDEKDNKVHEEYIRASIKVINPKIRKEIIEILKSIENIQVINDIFMIHILSSEANKSNNIELIAELEDIPKDRIYTIGDSKNDLRMIEEFNGYSSVLANSKCKKASNGTILSVGTFAENLENEFIKKRKF